MCDDGHGAEASGPASFVSMEFEQIRIIEYAYLHRFIVDLVPVMLEIPDHFKLFYMKVHVCVDKHTVVDDHSRCKSSVVVVVVVR